MRIQLISFALAFSLAGAAHAQAAPQPDAQQSANQPHHDWQGHGHDGHHGPPNPEFEAKMLTRRLSLTPEQTTAITPILTSAHEQMKALKPAPGTTPDFTTLRQQHEQIMAQTKQSIEAILTPEQKTEYEKMHQHHGGPHGEHHQPPTANPSL